MTIALIAADKAQNNALSQALSLLGQKVNSCVGIDDLPPDMDFGVAVYVWQKEDHTAAAALAQTKSVFAIVPTGQDLSDDELVTFSAVFKAPIRAGFLVDSLRAYQKQKMLRERLKPVTIGRYTLDPKTNSFRDNKNDIRLTDKERDILLLLQANEGRPVTRQAMLDHVWGYAEGVETHTLETHIYRLRQKIERDPSAPDLLMTNDQGYFLNL